MVWGEAVGFMLAEERSHYFEHCEGHLHLWFYFLSSPT